MSSVSRRIQLRRDTADNWTAVNPILAEGEIGYETTGFKRMKVGDGNSRWAALAYFNIGPTGRLGTTGPIGPNGEAANTGATGPTGVPGLSSGVTFQLNHTSAGPIVYTTVVSTLAGSSQGLTNEPGTVARFSNPSGTAVDSSGNVYVADTSNHVIRKITSSGVVSTFAGDGISGSKDGTGSNAQFNSPSAIVISSTGILYVSDAGNHRIRKITSTGIVTTFAGGLSGFKDGIGSNAEFNNPQGIVLDSLGNVFVADSGNHRIRSITPAGQVSTLAGQSTSGTTDDLGTAAKFNTPTGLAIDSLRNLYVTDKNNHRIRKVTAQGGVSTLAGSTSGFINDTGVAAQFNSPVGIAIDSTGTLYVADTENHRIRTVTSTGVVTTFVGLSTSGNTNGSPSQAQFSSPYSITVGTTGVFYVAEYANHRIRKIVVTSSDPNEYVFTPFIGTLITPLNSIPTTSSYIVVPERKTNTNIATFTIPLVSMPSTTSIVGQWVLGLNASVAVSVNPGSFYFEVLDGTSSIVVGASNRVAQTSSGVILATLTVPARVYTTNLTLKLFVTTRDFSPMTLRFNGSTLSYLNTTIINVGPTGATGPHLFTIFNKLDHRVITSITDKSDQLLANSNLTFNGSNLNVVNTVTTSNFRGQGTVATPPYAFTTDVTSGMFLPAASNLALATNATERVRILPSGNVGIATPTPGFTLDVSGTANVSGNLSVGSITTAGGGFSVPGNLTGAIIRASSNGTPAVPVYTFSNDLSSGLFIPFTSGLGFATAGRERMTITSTGRVGIGNQDPLTTLDVTGTANISGNLSVGSITTAGGGFSVPGNLTGGIIRASSNGTAALPAYTFSNDLFSGTFLPAVSNLAFTTAGVERMRITNANVGIGTTTPANTLDVSGTARISSTLSAGATTVSSLDAGAIITTGNLTGAIIRTSSNGTAAVPAYTFSNDLSSGMFLPSPNSLAWTTVGNERMRITSSGVGIGTTTPANTLDVTGTARITSTLSAGATTVSSLNAGSGAITTTGTASVNRLIGGIGYSTAALPTFGFEEFIGGNFIRQGIFNPDRGTLGISAYGVERMRVSSNGVGIGLPDNFLISNALDVSGNVRISRGLTAASASITDVSLNTINGSRYGGSGASGRTLQLDYSPTTLNTTVSTTAGDGGTTIMSFPLSIALGGYNELIICYSTRLVKYDISTQTFTHFAGSTSGDVGHTNGNGANARFQNNFGRGIAKDAAGNYYVTDETNHAIRKIASNADVTTFAGTPPGTDPAPGNTDGLGTVARFNGPTSIAIDSAGNLYVAEVSGCVIRKISSSGNVTTLAGSYQSLSFADGSGTSAGFNQPNGIVVDSAGNIYVADTGNRRIRKITSGGVVSTFAGSGSSGSGDGVGTDATFGSPYGLNIDSLGNLYVTDNGNHRIRIISSSGVVKTLAGTTSGFLDGAGTSARFNGPQYILPVSSSEVFVVDTNNHRIRRILVSAVQTYSGTQLTGTLLDQFNPLLPQTSFSVPAGTNAYVASFTLNASYPATVALEGLWNLGVYASVDVQNASTQLLYQIVDGSTTVLTGTVGTSLNKSGTQLYISALNIPARIYSTNVKLNLAINTTVANVILYFNGSTLSYLNTTILPYDNVVVANDYHYRLANGSLTTAALGILAFSLNSTSFASTPIPYAFTATAIPNSANTGNGGFWLAPKARFIVLSNGNTSLDITNSGTSWQYFSNDLTAITTRTYRLFLV